MAKHTLGTLQFTHMYASTSDRLQDIADLSQSAGFTCLNSTGVQRYGPAGAATWRRMGTIWWLDAGWFKSQHSNKSCGCSILLGQHIKRSTVVHIFVRPILGRGVALRARCKHYDEAVVSLYVPPVSAKAGHFKTYYQTCDSLMKWIRPFPFWSAHEFSQPSAPTLTRALGSRDSTVRNFGGP
eukprot:6861271-Pyramimonas_sp.AAC.1